MSGDPEGTVWYERSSLRTSEFNPDDPKQFYTHALVEVVYNSSWMHSYYNADVKLNKFMDYTNPRAGEQRWNPDCRDAYVRWRYLPIMYGPEKTDIKRIYQLNGNYGYWHLRDPPITCLIPVPMPTKEEKYLWMDLTFPVKAIRFPLCHEAAEEYRNMATYVQLDFKRRDITLKATDLGRHCPTGWTTFRRNPKMGFNYHYCYTIKFDVLQLLELLVLPRRDRKQGLDPYSYLEVFYAWNISATKAETTVKDSGMQPENIVDLIKLFNTEQGTSVSWDKSSENRNFITNVIVNLAQVGAAMIPYVGPLLVIAIDLGYQAILDVEQFKKTEFAEKAPAYVDAIINSALSVKNKSKSGTGGAKVVMTT